jgi:dienelactone hydrolase
MLHGRPLELHLASRSDQAQAAPLVLYASGDGGWFGAAVDMFQQIARAGYPVVGFSSKTFLKIERPRGALVAAAQLASEYSAILAKARSVLGLTAGAETILTGWSRGAAFAVLVASEPPIPEHLRGVVAIGLGEGEDLILDGPEDETDDGKAQAGSRHWPFETYARLRQIEPVRCAVIQATRDSYLPAAQARALFGPDTARRRFYVVEARNHRFSGGKAAFDVALLDALAWIAGPDER